MPLSFQSALYLEIGLGDGDTRGARLFELVQHININLVRGLRMRFVDRRQINQAVQPMGLKPPFVFVQLGPAHPPTPASFGHIAQFLCELQRTEAMPGDFL